MSSPGSLSRRENWELWIRCAKWLGQNGWRPTRGRCTLSHRIYRRGDETMCLYDLLLVWLRRQDGVTLRTGTEVRAE